jgi:hypothetical protein
LGFYALANVYSVRPLAHQGGQRQNLAAAGIVELFLAEAASGIDEVKLKRK